jgi:threonine/homoserine/homoserine lactone efflux protein
MDITFWTYLIPIVLLTLTPGVDTMLVIRNAGRGGWRDGVVSSLGICSGLFVHAVVSALGISLLLLQSAWGFAALKLIGAGYLCWLGGVSLWSAFRAKALCGPSNGGPPPRGFSPGRSFLEGFLSNVLNPKAIVFYMAFLPQFIDPAGSALGQSIFLAGVHFSVAMLWQSLLAVMVGHAGTLLVRSGIRRSLAGVTGAVILALGIRLGLDR